MIGVMYLIELTKKCALIFIGVLFYFESQGQNCSSVSEKKDKQKGIVTFGGVTTSKDFYSLLIQKEKEILDSGNSPKYIIYLNAASRVLFSDSILNTTGTFEVILLNGSKVTYSNVTYYNNPLGMCCSLGFKTYLTEDQIKVISADPIVSISVIGILTTTFSVKKQKEQQKIINCLISKV